MGFYGSYRRDKKKNQTGRIYVVVVMLFMVVALSVKIFSLYQKDREYKAREQALEQELLLEQQNQEKLQEYENYVGSEDYIEDEASKKLGLTYDNWIIFREKED